MTKVDSNENKALIVPFEEAAFMAGFGIFNVMIVLVSGFSLMCFIIEVTCMMFIIPAGQCDLKLNLTSKSLLSSVSFLGVVASSHLWGYITDIYGRRKVLMINLFTAGIISLACSIISQDWLFILLRFINGFAIGGTSSTVYAYAGEFHDKKSRSKILTCIGAFVNIGFTYMAGIAWLILPMQWSLDIPFLGLVFRPWRLLLIVYTLPSFILAIMVTLLPESPKFQLAQERNEEALKTFQTMFALNHRNSCRKFEVTDIVLQEELEICSKNVGLFKSMWNQTVPLFKGRFLAPTLMISTMQFSISASWFGLGIWYPHLINKLSNYYSNNKEAVTFCTAFLAPDDRNDTQSILCNDTIKSDVFHVSIVVSLGFFVTSIIIGLIINIFGKKQIITVIVLGSALVGILGQYMHGYLSFAIIGAIVRLGGGTISIINLIVVDFFPTKVRGMALAISLMFNRLGAMTGSGVLGHLLYYCCDYFFYIIAIDHLVFLIICYLLPTDEDRVSEAKEVNENQEENAFISS